LKAAAIILALMFLAREGVAQNRSAEFQRTKIGRGNTEDQTLGFTWDLRFGIWTVADGRRDPHSQP
jgi:hypothetical protein